MQLLLPKLKFNNFFDVEKAWIGCEKKRKKQAMINVCLMSSGTTTYLYIIGCPLL